VPGAGPPPGLPLAYGYAPPGPPGRYPYPPPGYVFAPVSPSGQPLASFGERLGAYVIDTLLYTAVALVLMVPLVALFILAWVPSIEAAESGATDGGEFFLSFGAILLLQAAFVVVLLGLLYLYHVEYLLRTGGQTLGKKALKLRVVPLDPGARLNRSMAGKRYLVAFVGGFIVPGLNYLDGLWQLWDKPFRQCLHDKFAQTVVIKVTGQ
jgi:uncharacterized RDD family membrane protein YckC